MPRNRRRQSGLTGAETSDPGPRLVLGLQPVREAIRRHGAELTRVWVEQRGAKAEALQRFARDQQVPVVQQVPRQDLDRLAGSVAHQGAAAWAPELTLTAASELWGRPGLAAIALDGIQDPQNFGAVIRSAVGLMNAAIIWPEHGAAPLTPATFRASAGAIEHATLCRVSSLSRALREAGDAGVKCIGLDPRAEQALRAVELEGPTLIVIGSEDRGMQRSVRKSCATLAHLVPPGKIQSLNASVAAAIALYEMQRQRGESAPNASEGTSRISEENSERGTTGANPSSGNQVDCHDKSTT